MAQPRRSLLAVVDLGGYPDFTSLYERCGFDVTTIYSMRKILDLCKRIKPDVVVAEFKYGPVYGSRISKLESLFPALQCTRPDARLIILLDKEERRHLRRLQNIFPIAAELTFPINQDALEKAVVGGDVA